MAANTPILFTPCPYFAEPAVMPGYPDLLLTALHPVIFHCYPGMPHFHALRQRVGPNAG